ncbi:CCR4-NOT transcription complex subunit 4 [Vitis vinifera]|uniref:CCR4-NOT transcription complex subunit 4 n=1 Tax=Vitis vinifera TaxID=29760 RepID=A0A438F9Z0_VITVI|nr:CCR4-NOT transcription complex subunit 4 [Vitis vinifera]
MSDEGEKTCPLCAEEMDLTDQQLKPCKCGYEICVWCWHHIMNMAEKDETEGRCPACRVPYNKEKIVGMAADCKRNQFGEKMKSQKAKTKLSEGRKQLGSVRVIQRNLVYIVGLPLNLADEDLLQRKEYFGLYGKVLKVSMSRTAAGVIQQFPNNTCSVYITYSKEEEAVRCIQTVHGFVLDGRPLRACFGTTKYCHQWLRNVGQQITGATNNLQRRSGNMLPPPADEYCNNSSASMGKPITKNASNNSVSIAKGSPPNSSSGRSNALPAAASWGMRSSNSQTMASSLSCGNGPFKQKPDSFSGSVAFSSAVTSTTLPLTTQAVALHSEVGKKPTLNEENRLINPKGKLESLESMKQHISMDTSEGLITPDEAPASLPLGGQLSCPPTSKDNDRGISLSPKVTNSSDFTRQPNCSGSEREGNVATDGNLHNLLSDMSSMSIDRQLKSEHPGVLRSNCSLSDNGLTQTPGSQGLQQYYAEQFKESLTSPVSRKVSTTINGVCVPDEQNDWRSDSQTQVVPNMCSEMEDDLLSFDNQRLKDSEVVSGTTYLPNSSHLLHHSNDLRGKSSQHNDIHNGVSFNADPIFVGRKFSEGSLTHAPGASVISNGFPEKRVGNSAGLDRANASTTMDVGENSIISNILSLDFDAWDDSITSPQNLAQLLGENDKQHSSLKTSGSWKVQNSNQSRFSFARQEESKNQVFDIEPSFSNIGQVPRNCSFNQNFVESRDPFLDKLGNGSLFSSNIFGESDNFAPGHSVISSNKISASRAQISAPPGFTVPSRAPPPGFSSHERTEQAFDAISGNHLLDTSSLLRNPYQTPSGNIASAGDIEFIDPAILAVGKGRLPGGLNNPALDMRSNFHPQLSAFENEARLQLLMQRSLSPHQNLRFADIGEGFSPLGDAYGIPSRLMEQSQASNISPFAQLSLQQSRNAIMSNGHWDGWNEIQSGNDLNMAELLRNERLGYNKFYTGYEDSKFRMPTSGDLEPKMTGSSTAVEDRMDLTLNWSHHRAA